MLPPFWKGTCDPHGVPDLSVQPTSQWDREREGGCEGGHGRGQMSHMTGPEAFGERRGDGEAEKGRTELDALRGRTRSVPQETKEKSLRATSFNESLSP